MGMYFFPTPYPDELLYSVLARYCIQSGNNNYINNFDDIFGSRNVIASVEFQGRLDLLMLNMPKYSEYTIERFIFQHTLFPYYLSFSPEEKAREVIELMSNKGTSKIYNKTGIVSHSIKTNLFLRFCPKCNEEDFLKYGENYWHRLHQIPGVLMCPIHKVTIQDSIVHARGANRQSFIGSNSTNCINNNRADVYSKEIVERLVEISREVELLLTKEYEFQNVDVIKYRYMDRLIEKKIACQNTMVHHKKLRKLLIDYWGAEVLNLVQSEIYLDKNCSWLEKLVIESKTMFQPMRNILLYKALGMDADTLLNSKIDAATVIPHKILWEEKLKKLCKEELSLREIAIKLDSTSITIKKYIEKNGIENFWINNGGGKYINKPYLKTPEYISKRDESRDKWSKIIEENPNKSKTYMMKKDQGLHSWLIRYDNEWLQNNSPKRVEVEKHDQWKERDIELLPIVVDIVEKMKEGKPQRIRWHSIGGKMGINGSLLNRKNKMPLVKAYIESVEETLEEFQIRKIKWAIRELENNNESITKWKLIEKSGVNYKYIRNIKSEVRAVLRDCGYNEDLLD